MKILKNKFLVKLIVAICLFLTLINFIPTRPVYAADSDDQVWGGVLIKPITSLMTAIGDSIMDVLHYAVMDQNTSIIKISGETNWGAFWKTAAAWVLGILAAIAFVAVAAASAGLANAALAVLAGGTFTFTMSATSGMVLGGIAVGIWCGISVGSSGWLGEDIYLPAFTISAEEIFADSIPVLHVNFFSPQTYVRTETQAVEENVAYSQETIYTGTAGTSNPPVWSNLHGVTSSIANRFVNEATGANFTSETELNSINWGSYSGGSLDLYDYNTSAMAAVLEIINQEQTADSLDIIDASHMGLYSIVGKTYQKLEYDEDGNLENEKFYNILKIRNNERGEYVFTIKYNFSTLGENYGVPADLTIIREAGSFTGIRYVESTEEVLSTAKQLRGIISTWYFILRNVALIVLMLLLIYSGIRIVTGSTAGEKAKYKERITDWLVAVCLVMIMHYIMVFAVTIVEEITDLVRTFNNKNLNVAFIPLTQNQWNNADDPDKMDWSEFGVDGTFENIDGTMTDGIFVEVSNDIAESGHAIVWQTDLAGLFRIQAQLENEGTAKWVGYSFCYCVLVLFTLFFAFTYIRRVLYMAFLTMIAPLVAMTYPIDKITDGKAQAFDAWLKEYIFNLMIQPLHLLLYSVLVTSAFKLASTNPIYALVAVGFMMPAEKLMRRFFGFEKAKTPGLLGGAAGAAIAMSGLQSMLKPKGHGGKGDSGSKSHQDDSKVKFAHKNSVDYMGGIAGPGEKPSPTTTPTRDSNNTPTTPPRESNDDIDEDDILSNTTLGSGGWDHGGFTGAGGAPGTPGTPGGDDEPLDLDDDDIDFSNTTLGNDDWDHGGFTGAGVAPTGAPGSPSGADEDDAFWDDDDIDDMFANTTLGSEDWDHDGFGRDNVGEGPRQDPPQEEPPRQDPPQEDSREEKPKRHLWRAVGTAALGAGGQAAKGLARGVLKGAHPLRWAGQIATGATVATAGMLLGVASGDPSKTFQYTTAGAMAGSALAKSLSGGSEVINGEEIKEDAQRAYYGENYRKEMIRKEKEAFQKNSENIKYLKDVLHVNTSEAKKIMQETGGKCYENGITSIEDIAAIHKLTDTSQKDHVSFEYAVAARNYATKRLPADPETMTGEKIKKYKDRWAQEYKEAGYKNSTKLADDSFDAAIRFSKAKSSLTKI